VSSGCRGSHQNRNTEVLMSDQDQDLFKVTVSVQDSPHLDNEATMTRRLSVSLYPSLREILLDRDFYKVVLVRGLHELTIVNLDF